MSATIYEFPARGRYAVSSQPEQIKTVMANYASSRNVKTVVGQSWYHDEAIEAIEAERAPKN
jgi:hypothetical protein